MDNISGQIGALELDDHLESYSDGVLEATVLGPSDTNPRHFLTCVADAALEAAGMSMEPGTQLSVMPNCSMTAVCRH